MTNDARTKSRRDARVYASPMRLTIIALLQENGPMTIREMAELLDRKCCTVQQSIKATRKTKPNGRKWFRICRWEYPNPLRHSNMCAVWSISELRDKPMPKPAGSKIIQARYYQKTKRLRQLKHLAKTGQPINHWLHTLSAPNDSRPN